jgi:hypothetical protein
MVSPRVVRVTVSEIKVEVEYVDLRQGVVEVGMHDRSYLAHVGMMSQGQERSRSGRTVVMQ